MVSAPPENQTPKLRMAIMCHGLEFPAWIARSIEETLSLDFVEPVLLIRDPRGRPPPAPLFERIGTYPYRELLYRLYARYIGRPAAMRQVSLKDKLAGVPRIECEVELRGKYSQYFKAADLEKIRAHAPDFILRFAYNIIRGEILTVAPYGVWSFHHGDVQKYRGAPAGFWEILKRDPVTGAMLQRLTHRLDAGVVLKTGVFRTFDRSYTTHVNQLLWSTASWVKQICIDIRNGKAPYFDAGPAKTRAPVYRLPGNLTFLRFAATRLWNTLAFNCVELFRPDEWNVAVIDKAIEEVFRDGLKPGEARWLPRMPRYMYRADPFLSRENGGPRILFEEFDYRVTRGVIASAAADAPIESRELIAGPCHLSYPFTLEHEGRRYCVPEARASGHVLLYEWSDADGRWNLKSRLLEGFPGVDPTIFPADGRWWLLCTHGYHNPNGALYAFHAPHPTGPYTPHANNPIKYDVTSARPAGLPFVAGGRLIRPGQDCSRTYGYCVVFNHVTRLSPEEFREEPVGELKPQPTDRYDRGLHHIASDGRYTVIDGKCYAFNFANFRTVLAAKLRRWTGR